jgi:Spy/CpxP family protein refolding chaperone
MKKTLSQLAFVTTLAASLAFAQNTGSTSTATMHGNGVQHRVTFLTTLLTLTTAQQQQATTIFTNAASSAAAVHGSMKTAHEALKTAINANDAATIDQTATTIGTLTAQMTSIEAKAQAAFYLILTPEQQTKLTQFESQGGHGFGGAMGPAGFHGPR